VNDIIRELLQSKKFLAAIAGAAVVVLNKALSIDMPEEDLLKILGMIATYIVGQSVADFGKEKAKVEKTGEMLKAMEKPFPPPDQALVNVVERNRAEIKKILAD